MDAETFLIPDPRWELWQCSTHQEYLNRFYIPGKFNSEVPKEVKAAYETVERLISYSYFYYPMTEEVISKMSRIFEMAVRKRAKALGIKTDGLYNLIIKIKKHPDTDGEWAEEWDELKRVRDIYSHPENQNFFGPMSLRSVYPMINIINSIFCPRVLLEEARVRLDRLKKTMITFVDGVFIIEHQNVNFLIRSIIPVSVSHDNERSLWLILPVGNGFPKTMDEYNDMNPILLRLKGITYKDGILEAFKYPSNERIRLYRTDHPVNLKTASNYQRYITEADDDVQQVHLMNINFHLYYEREKFIYDEYWV